MVFHFISLILLSSLQLFGQTNGGDTTTPTTTPTTQTAVQSITTAGVSNITGLFAGEINSTTTVIHGGLSGGLVEGCASTTHASTCNNCAADANACNTRRIHDGLNFTIQFRPSTTSTNNIGGPAFVSNNLTQGQDEFETLDIVSQSPSGNVIPNAATPVSVTLNWGDICNKFFKGGSGGCAAAETGVITLNLSIDENRDSTLDESGVTEVQISLTKLNADATDLCKVDSAEFNDLCNFTVFPGDKKVFVEQVRTDCSFPSSVGDGTATAVRIFREEVSANLAPNALSKSTDLPIATSSASCSTSKTIELTENIVGDLENGTQYWFTAGLVDQANNVGGIVDVSATLPIEDDNIECFDGEASSPANCHVATPDEVIGLIEKEFDCFITTATYGSPFRPKVEDFRAFRNQFLHSHWLGRKLIKFYYRTSPPIADWIRQHPESKPAVRAILYPAWLFAKACLQYPLLMLIGFLVTLVLITSRKLSRRTH